MCNLCQRAWLTLLVVTVASSTASAQDRGLNRRETGLLDPLTGPSLGGARQVVPSGSGGGGRAADATDDYGEQEILVPVDAWNPWSFGVSFGYEFQDNAALSPTTEVEDYLFRQSASGRGTFQLTDTLYLSIGAQQQLFRYDELDILDFDRLDGDAGILWSMPEDWPIIGNSILTVKGSYYRMSEAGNFGSELFSNTGAGAGLLRSIALGRNHALLLSGTADISVDASDDAPQRDEYALLAAVTSRWAPQWETSVFVRATFYDYNEHDDWNFIAAASIDWVPRDWCRLGISTNFIHNDSDDPSFDYDNWGIGANLRLSVQF